MARAKNHYIAGEVGISRIDATNGGTTIERAEKGRIGKIDIKQQPWRLESTFYNALPELSGEWGWYHLCLPLKDSTTNYTNDTKFNKLFYNTLIF
jgi:hypothetical protein